MTTNNATTAAQEFDDLNEEWLMRYRHVSGLVDSFDGTGSLAERSTLLEQTIGARAGRLSVLQVAAENLKDDQVIRSAHLRHVKKNMDRDAASAKYVQLLEGLVETTFAAEMEMMVQEHSNQQQQQNDDAASVADLTEDMDIFFLEYPEFMKTPEDRECEDDTDDDDDSDSDGDGDGQQIATTDSHRTAKRNKNNGKSAAKHSTINSTAHISSSHGKTIPSSNKIAINPYGQSKNQHQKMPPQPPSNQQAHPRPPTNPSNLAPPPAYPVNPNQPPNQFSYTQLSDESQQHQQQQHQQRQRQHQVQQSSNQSWNNGNARIANNTNTVNNSNHSNANNGYFPPPNPYQSSRPNSRPGRSTTLPESTSTWEDYRNQNPFSTAREFAQQEKVSNNNNNNSNNINNNNNSVGMYGGAYGGQHNQNNTTVLDGDGHDFDNGSTGPPAHIPDSLRRKFQPPKRVAGEGNQSGNPTKPSTGGLRKVPRAVTATNTAGRPSGGNGSSSSGGGGGTASKTAAKDDDEEELPEELQHLDKALVKKIINEIQESGDPVTFSDIAGLDDAKQTVQEVVCWPMKRPDLFTGLRRAPNGLLLYGPPGTGKTLIGKAIAHESGATFFSISSSSLTSKWIGEGEKLVRTLFAVAAYREPAVVFLDEIDSLLTQRKSDENEASRRIKTEFLVQLDGTGTSGQGRVLIIGATNRPQELDEAARRRFTKRLYIPLPDESDRGTLLRVMLGKNNHRLSEHEVDRLAKDTDGFSGADLKSLCTDAAMGPIRQLGSKALEVKICDVPPIAYKHFRRSLKGMKPSVAPADLVQYVEWDKTYGSKRATEDEDEEYDSEEG